MFSRKILLVAMAAAGLASPMPKIEARALDGNTFVDDMLVSHNFYRSQHGVSDLTWSTDGASYSQQKADSCIFGHQDPISGYGENIYTATGSGSFKDSVNGWGQERNQYNWVSPGFTEATGHFTQLVWAGTSQVGCGWKDCGDSGGDSSRASGVYVVCKYAGPGNFADQYVTNVFPQTSGSPTDRA